LAKLDFYKLFDIISLLIYLEWYMTGANNLSVKLANLQKTHERRSPGMRLLALAGCALATVGVFAFAGLSLYDLVHFAQRSLDVGYCYKSPFSGTLGECGSNLAVAWELIKGVGTFVAPLVPGYACVSAALSCSMKTSSMIGFGPD
jgi:hypothetical protein